MISKVQRIGPCTAATHLSRHSKQKSAPLPVDISVDQEQRKHIESLLHSYLLHFEETQRWIAKARKVQLPNAKAPPCEWRFPATLGVGSLTDHFYQVAIYVDRGRLVATDIFRIVRSASKPRSAASM